MHVRMNGQLCVSVVVLYSVRHAGLHACTFHHAYVSHVNVLFYNIEVSYSNVLFPMYIRVLQCASAD